MVVYADVINVIGYLLDYIGVVFVVFGVLSALYKILKMFAARVSKRFFQYEHIKRGFVQKLIFGLDFFIAGDIIRITVIPGLEGLTRLGVVVAIRTILAYFLGKEIHLHKE